MRRIINGILQRTEICQKTEKPFSYVGMICRYGLEIGIQKEKILIFGIYIICMESCIKIVIFTLGKK